jgi:hypothetical protein
MMIDRRSFIAGTIVLAAAPPIQLLASQHSSSATRQSRVDFMISGWSVQDDRAGVTQAWITVSNSWQAAWR